MHCSRGRLLRRGQECHVCTINKSAHTKKVWKLFVCTSYPYISASCGLMKMSIANEFDFHWVPHTSSLVMLLSQSMQISHSGKNRHYPSGYINIIFNHYKRVLTKQCFTKTPYQPNASWSIVVIYSSDNWRRLKKYVWQNISLFLFFFLESIVILI